MPVAAANQPVSPQPASPQPGTDSRLALIVDPTQPSGLLANTVAVIAVGLGAADGSLGAMPLLDRRGRATASIANRPIPVLQAEGPALAALLARALPAPPGGVVVAFPRFGRSLHVFEDYRALFPSRDLLEEPIEGIGLAGPPRWVKSLTGSLRLLR